MPEKHPKRVLPFVILCAAVIMACQVAQAQTRLHRFNHLDSSLKLHLSNDFDPVMQRRLIDWTGFISSALLQVYGHWPRQEWEISVTPISTHNTDPIPWAQVKRGDPDRVEFYTAVTASTEELKSAWTSYHELSHLLIPYRGWGDMWFSEGLASYYQNVIQARVGLLSEQALWQNLYASFKRGRAQSEFSSMDLQSLSAVMRQKGAFMRVYWSGAWYFLQADLELRRRSGGTRSLDTALGQLNRCCANQKMSVPQMVRKLDELNKLDLFEPLYRELIHSTQMPDFEATFTALGISVTDEKVELQTLAPAARYRRQIAAPKSL